MYTISEEDEEVENFEETAAHQNYKIISNDNQALTVLNVNEIGIIELVE